MKKLNNFIKFLEKHLQSKFLEKHLQSKFLEKHLQSKFQLEIIKIKSLD